MRVGQMGKQELHAANVSSPRGASRGADENTAAGMMAPQHDLQHRAKQWRRYVSRANGGYDPKFEKDSAPRDPGGDPNEFGQEPGTR